MSSLIKTKDLDAPKVEVLNRILLAQESHCFRDCVAEDVKMVGRPSDKMMSVSIEGVQTTVSK